MHDIVATDDGREVVPVQQLIVQALYVDDSPIPNEMKPRSLSQDDLSVNHFLVVQRADVALSASVP